MGSVGRKEPPAQIAGGAGGGRRLRGEKICGLLVRAVGVFQLKFFQRDMVSLAGRELVKAQREKKKTHTKERRDRLKTHTYILLLSNTQADTPLNAAVLTFQEETKTNSLTFKTRPVCVLSL